jgi:hypothetical protein
VQDNFDNNKKRRREMNKNGGACRIKLIIIKNEE